jgi:hypothetical protein
MICDTPVGRVLLLMRYRGEISLIPLKQAAVALWSVLEPRSAREMKIKDVGSARRRLFWGGRNNLPRQATPYLPGRSLLRAAHL